MDRISTVYTPWLDSTPPSDVTTAPTSTPHRKTVFDYTLLSGDAGTDLVTPRRVENYVDATGGAPQLVSRSYVLLTTDNSVYPPLDVRKDVSCRNATATWDDASNPVTTTKRYASGAFKGS